MSFDIALVQVADTVSVSFLTNEYRPSKQDHPFRHPCMDSTSVQVLDQSKDFTTVE